MPWVAQGCTGLHGAAAAPAHLGQSDAVGDMVPAVALKVWLGAGGADAEIPPPPYLEAARVAAAQPRRCGRHARPTRRHAAARSKVEALSARTLAPASAGVELSIARTSGDALAATDLVWLGTARLQSEVAQPRAELGRLQRVAVKPHLGELAIDEPRGETRRLQTLRASEEDSGLRGVQGRLFGRGRGAVGPRRASEVRSDRKSVV